MDCYQASKECTVGERKPRSRDAFRERAVRSLRREDASGSERISSGFANGFVLLLRYSRSPARQDFSVLPSSLQRLRSSIIGRSRKSDGNVDRGGYTCWATCDRCHLVRVPMAREQDHCDLSLASFRVYLDSDEILIFDREPQKNKNSIDTR